MANLKTVRKWQETLNYKLDILEIVDGSKTYQMRGLLKVRRSY